MDTVIMKRQVGWSMLQYAITITLEQQKLFTAITGEPLKVGTKRDIKLIIDGEFYDAHFRNEAFNRNKHTHSDIVMLSYGIDVKRKLQSIFKESYDMMLEFKKTLPPRGRMPEINNSDEYVVLSATSNPNVFILDCVTNAETKDIQEKMKGISEEVFESFEFEPIIDSTAGFCISNTVRKVRKLDRNVCDSLKRLYNYRCQMTGERIGDPYNALVVEAHHIIPFTESMNNDTSNIIILSPSYHRIVHKAKPIWDEKQLAFCFPNGLVEKVKLNYHLKAK